MSETMRSHSQSAEYYFEYKIEKIFGEENIKTPKLYFERDCTSQAYALYIAPEEWLEQQEVLGELKSKLKDNKGLFRQKPLSSLTLRSVTPHIQSASKSYWLLGYQLCRI